VTGIRAIFSLPSAYRLAQNIIGAESFRQTLVGEILRVEPEARVLDIGCGTADILDHLPSIDYVGFDHSEGYIDSARARFGGRGRFVAGTAGAEALADVGARDLAIAIGVLHHLDDVQAAEALELAHRALRPGGRFVSVDPTFAAGQHRIGRWLAGRDRGQHVRTPAQTADLVSVVFPDTAVDVRHDLLRIPYSHVICQAMRT
jgi:SAM-dependent methyltransferase